MSYYLKLNLTCIYQYTVILINYIDKINKLLSNFNQIQFNQNLTVLVFIEQIPFKLIWSQYFQEK